MAGPLLTAIPNELGRIVYRKAGRFISQADFLKEKRRLPTGRFQSKTDYIKGLGDRDLESYLRDAFGGGPLGGGQWVARVKQSAERFANMLAGQNRL